MTLRERLRWLAHSVSAPGLAIVLTMWALAAGVGWYTLSSPYEPLPGDHVAPVPVHYMGEACVYRNFRTTRSMSVTVIRQAQSEGCFSKTFNGCDIVELATGEATFAAGEQLPNIMKCHQLLSSIRPGKWMLVFYLKWTGAFGITRAVRLPDLEIEVVP